LARSSYKGIYFCRRSVTFLSLRCLLERRPRLGRFHGATVIPNVLEGLIVRIEGVSNLRTLVTTRLNVMHRVGELTFTRKPFNYPYNKKKRVK
jgi:hypothetical protein